MIWYGDHGFILNAVRYLNPILWLKVLATTHGLAYQSEYHVWIIYMTQKAVTNPGLNIGKSDMPFSNMANVSSNSFTRCFAPGKQFSETFAIFEKGMSDFPILRPLIGWSRIRSREVCKKISSFWEVAHWSESAKEKKSVNKGVRKSKRERACVCERERNDNFKKKQRSITTVSKCSFHLLYKKSIEFFEIDFSSSFFLQEEEKIYVYGKIQISLS